MIPVLALFASDRLAVAARSFVAAALSEQMHQFVGVGR